MLEEMVQDHQRQLIENLLEVVVQEQQELRDQAVLMVVQEKVLHLYLVQPLNLFILLMDVIKVLLLVVYSVVVEQEDKIHKDFHQVHQHLVQVVNTLVVLEEVVMHVLNQDLEIVVLILVIQEQLTVVVEVELVFVQILQDLLLVDLVELVVQVMFYLKYQDLVYLLQERFL
jgi:hypothetical protein